MSLKSTYLKNEIKISKNELDIYKKMFKHIISKNIENYTINDDLKNILSSITEKEILFSYIIFSNYNFSIESYFDDNINNNDVFSYLFNITKDISINEKLIVLWYIFLFNSLCNNKINIENGSKKLNQLNEFRYLLNETNNIIFKLYLSKKLKEEKIFTFIDLFIFWIEYYSNFYFNNEKNRKIKNIYIFEYLFSLVNKITTEMIKNINKEKLGILINFMEILKKNDEINNKYNIIILIKFNYIGSFIEKLLYNINFQYLNQINDNYINILLNFCTHFLKFKFSLSNIFDKILDNTRIAYEHLYNFEDNIKKIINDLNIQTFQSKLIKNLFKTEEDILNNEEFPPMNDSFLFNGMDSILSFKMDNLDFHQNCIFFSFNFNPNISNANKNIISPILSIQKLISKDSKNYIYENIFLLYIKNSNKKGKESDTYSLHVSQPLTKEKTNNKKEEKIIIKKNVNYYCCIYFENENVNIYIYYDSFSQTKAKKKVIKLKLNNISQKTVILSFGCDFLLYNKDIKEKDGKNYFFSGYIGPVIIIKDLISKISRRANIEGVIEKILLLKEGYKDLLFIRNRDKSINNSEAINTFNEDMVDYSFINEEFKRKEKSINSLLKKHFDSLECLLYLIPNCFSYFDSNKEISKKNYIPLVSNFCNKHINYKIKKLNITLSNHFLSINNFINDNGFNYFCLQFEYFNQLIQYYLVNKEINKKNFNDIFMNNNNILLNDIISCIKMTLLILGNRGNEINLSKAYKQTFMTLFNLLKNLNKIKPIINDIIGDLISLSDIYKSNIYNNYNNYELINSQQNMKKDINNKDKENEKNKKNKKKNELTEEKVQQLKEKYISLIKKNCSFFVGIMEILLSKEFYINNKIDIENYLLMKLTFEKVSSIMDIKDYKCLSFLSYQNLFIEALSFTKLLKNLMVDYMPDINVQNNKSNNFYFNFGTKNYVKTASDDENNNVLTSYFKLLNIFFRNKAINKTTSKEYFENVFRFIFGNHRYDLPIVYNLLHMFYYFIAENYKFYINNDEILQIFDFLNEITKLKEEDLNNFKNNEDESNDNIENEGNNEEKKETDILEEKENEENLNINEKIQENINNIYLIKRKEKIKSVLICILLEILLSQEEMPESLHNLLNYINDQKISKNLFLLIKDEIDKYFTLIFNDKEESLQVKKNIKNFQNYFSYLFNFITALIQLLLSNNIDYNNFDGEEEKNLGNIISNMETQKMWCVLSLINILSDVSNKIEDNINKELYKEESIYCVLIFLKFLYYIIMDNKLNILYAHNLFFTTAENVFNHCNKLSLNNSLILICLENEGGAMKTVAEIIFDIYIEYSTKICLNNQKANFFKNNNIQFFAALKIQNYFIIENKNTKLKEKNKFNYNELVSIFFINDYLRLILSNKKYLKNGLFNFDITQKISEIKELDDTIEIQNKFGLLFMIYFLVKIGIYKKEISKKLMNSENEIKMLNQLNRVLIEIQKVIIDDYKKLYIINKDYCAKSNSDYPNYNIFKNVVESKIINEIKQSLEDKLFTEIINDLDSKINNLSQEDYNIIKSGLSSSILSSNKHRTKRGSRNFTVADLNISTNLNKSTSSSDKNLNKKLNKVIETPSSVQDTSNSRDLLSYNFSDNNKINEEEINIKIKRKKSAADKEYNSRESENIFANLERETSYIKKIIPLPNIDNIICFFEQYDEMYLKNPKKELMNTIFSIYFKDSFYYNKTFIILKNYYLNNFEAQYYTKVLNYPSKIKHFNNGLEPPLFLKGNSSFYISKVFPITHDYFYIYMLKKKLLNDSIILFKKQLPISPKIKNNKIDVINFDYNCELISVDHSFYGHIINSKENRYLIFTEKKFSLYEKEPRDEDDYYSDLFSICTITKKPNKYKKIVENENQRNKINKIVERGITKKVIILYSEIEQIIERRFLLMWQGIEIYLKNGKSYFFNLLDDQKCHKVLEIFNNDQELNNKLILKNNFEKHINMIQKEWEYGRLDTYEYLLFINKYSSRSYNDSNQYLVFPWLLKNYNKIQEINNNDFEIFKYLNQLKEYGLDEKEENEPENEQNKTDIGIQGNLSNDIINEGGSQGHSGFNKIKKSVKFSKIGSELFKLFRELKYPICAQTEKNKELAIKRYVEDCQFNFKYHSGTHYSTSAYVYFYLMRSEPFSTLLVKLQNYAQENPNRMFNGIQSTVLTLDSGNDNRELLPEFFSKIEHFINFNCVNLGKKTSRKIVDDAYINKDKIPQSFNLLSNKIDFIIEHKKLLNSDSIAMTIGDWINNIFGNNQLPDEDDRPLSCNVYVKSSYEQETNLKKKLNKIRSPEYKKTRLTPERIVQKLADKINMIICFGQTPYQLFNENHPPRKKEEFKKIEEKTQEKTAETQKDKKYLEEENDLDPEYLMGEDDVQSLIINFIRPEKTISNIEVKGLYFEINPSINKVFILGKEREISILNSKLYDRKGDNYYNVFQEQKIKMPYMKFFRKINNDYIKNYYILKQKYCFSSFIKEDNNIKDNYYFYYNKYVNELLNSKDKSNKDNKDNNEINYYKFITCRYLDNTFKINIILMKDNQKKKDKEKNKEKVKNEETNKIFSFICEDFVSSCCTISEDEFLIGLRNGKLIKGKIFAINNYKSNGLEDIEIDITYEKYIQAHKGSINVIEIDKRLGVIITGGDDNYIYIRKLYDFEMLTPIKIKDKYIITMAKISPMNLLYIVCLNKLNKHSIIFGYNLSGIQFAKSEYGYFTNIDFTKNGNIVSLINRMDIGILFGSNLKRIIIKEKDSDCEDFFDKQKKIDGALWLQYDYFTRKNSNTKCRIISYIAKDYSFNTIKVDNIKYFD